MTQILGWVEFGLIGLQIAVDVLNQAAQFTINREADILTGNIGADGEAEARRLLSEKGYDVKLSVQSNIGQGVDIIAQDSRGNWVVFEVKATVRDISVNTPLELSDAQRDMQNFVRTRLQAASAGRGNYAYLSAEARQVAAEALREFESAAASGRTVRAFVSEVRFPLYYMTRVPKMPFSITFRRWR